MADAPQQRHNNHGASNRLDNEEPASMPTWVKVSGLILGVLLLLLAATMLIAGGEHGPGRHATRDLSTQQMEGNQRGTGHLHTTIRSTE